MGRKKRKEERKKKKNQFCVEKKYLIKTVIYLSPVIGDFKNPAIGGTWAQLVKHWTYDLSSGLDLKPHAG